MNVNFDPWQSTLAQKTVHHRPEPFTLAQMTVQFGSRPSTFAWPSTLRTVHCHPFGPSTSDQTLGHQHLDVTLLLDRPLLSLMAVQFSFFRPFIFSLNCPLSVFLTVDFYPPWPYSVLTLNRQVLSFRSLSRTVHFQSFGSSSLSLLDRPFWTGPHLWKIIFIEK